MTFQHNCCRHEMQHSELAEWSLFSLPPSDEQSAFYTSSVFIWLCFFWRKFLWDWLQFIFILITLPGRKNGTNHKISQFSIQQWTSRLSPPKSQKTCKWMCLSVWHDRPLTKWYWTAVTSCSRTLPEDWQLQGLNLHLSDWM